ncbi:hypothetical protein HZA38_00290 [Candidatus Peregrinibacteria bacterium]|nr:hypothetical protein [Candidatus Peregrinibacteria bacterium]
MFNLIISPENIQGAYFDLLEKFDAESKSSRYSGIDGVELNDFCTNSAELLQIVAEELRDFAPLSPVLEHKIPKSPGKLRSVYIYTVKDRIKAQAIFRVVEPIFEASYSPFLYSYRSSHPCHFAAKSVIRRYMKSYGEDAVFRTDIKDYTDELDHGLLREKLANLGFSSDVLRLLDLFIGSPVFSDGAIIFPKKGVTQGISITTHFLNIYLNDLDASMGKKVALYRRVGDDVIMCDKDFEKIQKMKELFMEFVQKEKLEIQEKKTKLLPSTEPFSFLGYDFSEKTVRIKLNSTQKIINRWKQKLKFYPIPLFQKIKRLQNMLFTDDDSIHLQFVGTLSAYRFANDLAQIQYLSKTFYRVLTRYFFGEYSERLQRKMFQMLQHKKVPSFFQYYFSLHRGKLSFTDLALSAKK